MEAEKVLKLYDSCWFELEIFKTQQPFSPNSSTSSVSEPDQDQNQDNSAKPEMLPPSNRHNRSMSDQLNTNTSFTSGSLSPDSPKLLTILSGKEIAEFEGPNKQSSLNQFEEGPKKKVVNGGRRRSRRRKGGESKSLSDLEFEELKGFMDLGFVFLEEDRESSLASIIPGLQRLGKKDGKEEREENEEEEEEVDSIGSGISRPYLSEAWEVFDMMRKKETNPLINWRVPALSNEVDMKDNLRWWAHTVASTVR
ncbi:hypothetical protein PanWU01x14_292180 [Parasponia andersonii]|uniref:DUF1685 family protein n=1 Tax=Parasponia andersonii TaxID=3476 RepID=A0A2P5AXB3_PARAD|nr:hypothetical protein PanWU01x14_292180 [Parasponia andersonii]